MSRSGSARDLVDRWRAGDQMAAEELYRRYAQRLWRLAEGQMGQRLGRRVDPDDIVQSVFRTFFRRTEKGEYSVDHSGALWQLLIQITLNKVRNQAQRHRAGKRDIAAEECPDGDHVHAEAIAHDPTPEEVVALADELETILAGLEQSDTDIVGLRLEGRSTSEIATQTGCSRWTVRRVLDRVGQRLRSRLDEYSGQ